MTLKFPTSFIETFCTFASIAIHWTLSTFSNLDQPMEIVYGKKLRKSSSCKTEDYSFRKSFSIYPDPVRKTAGNFVLSGNYNGVEGNVYTRLGLVPTKDIVSIEGTFGSGSSDRSKQAESVPRLITGISLVARRSARDSILFETNGRRAVAASNRYGRAIPVRSTSRPRVLITLNGNLAASLRVLLLLGYHITTS